MLRRPRLYRSCSAKQEEEEEEEEKEEKMKKMEKEEEKKKRKRKNKKMKLIKWTEQVQDRLEWKGIVEKAKTVPEL